MLPDVGPPVVARRPRSPCSGGIASNLRQGLLASRSGSRRSGKPPAARRARRKSGDACSLAWPGRWDSGRSGHPRARRGRNNCPRLPLTNHSGAGEQANRAERNGSDPIRPPVASRADAASTSSQIRTRVPAGTSARECRCEARKQCRSGTRDPKRVAAHLRTVVVESARMVRQVLTTDLEVARRPCPFTLPRRRGSGSEVLLHALMKTRLDRAIRARA
jgi:hypothetical protein